MEDKLGRGLSAILGEDSNKEVTSVSVVNLNLIVPKNNQPRKYFDEEKLKELSNSIGLYGILQPLVVRRKEGNNDEYELLSGERRFRAAKMAGLVQVPVHVINCEDKNIFAISLVENLQRHDLNMIEEAEAFKSLIESFGCTQESLSSVVSKSRSYITNAMRLLTLTDNVREMVKNGELSSGHAKLLIGLPDAEEIAQECIDQKMSVRTLEYYIKHKKSNKSQEYGTKIEKYTNPEEEELSNRISSILGMKTKLKISNYGGMLTIYCATCEQLENLTQLFLSLEKPKVEPRITLI
ncbi:MAG: ParB/RepB/Spo0J family partition protein [Holosporales bacterium]|jgi:ParB family chromosome partitioning protein|nr:ParB/RepB/Spo0J family partition protein [Holosporales bacterium]